MALAAVGALAIGHWEEAAMVISLYAVGVALEGAATDRTRRSLRALVDARPAEALVQRPNLRQETVPADQLTVGDLLIVKPGAQIAADGVIVSGASSVTEAAITGESLPKDKGRGDTVYAGSVNGTGSLLVRVTAPAADFDAGAAACTGRGGAGTEGARRRRSWSGSEDLHSGPSC
jgi:Cd2+/Zn2+-exporting ATPase